MRRLSPKVDTIILEWPVRYQQKPALSSRGPVGGLANSVANGGYQASVAPLFERRRPSTAWLSSTYLRLIPVRSRSFILHDVRRGALLANTVL